MAKKTDVLKEKILHEVLSMSELESIMSEFEFVPVEAEDDTEIIKFTNYNSQIWIEGESDNDGNILVSSVIIFKQCKVFLESFPICFIFDIFVINRNGI